MVLQKVSDEHKPQCPAFWPESEWGLLDRLMIPTTDECSN